MSISHSPFQNRSIGASARRPCTLFTLLATSAVAGAQPQASPPPDAYDLAPVVVTGTAVPRGSDEMAVPVTVVGTEAIRRASSATLGDLLADSPGISATSFAPGASRPVIRGFDGVRIRVLERGIDSGDVSDTSPDHAVSIEPLFTSQVEVVRGPATLLYGSQAVGGVVNVIDRRLPGEGLARPVEAEALIRHDGASRGWTGGVIGSTGSEQVVVTVAGLWRRLGDHRIPVPAESEAYHEAHHEHDEHEAEEPPTGRLGGSRSESQAHSVGLGLFPYESTRIALSFKAIDSLYGVPGHAHGHEEEDHAEEDHDHDHGEHHEADHGEEGVAIDLRHRRWDTEVEQLLKDGFLRSLKVRAGLIDYGHVELEGDEVGTTFARETGEVRAEAGHAFGDDLPGVVGFQWLESDLDAVGSEAFVPGSTTSDRAGFFLQEWRLSQMRVEAGGRLERRSIDAGVAGSYEGTASSFSAGLHRRLGGGVSAAIAVARSERHPTAPELFANGPHAATGQFEVGDPSLGIETSTGVDLTIRAESEAFSGSLSAFVNTFDDFIAARPTGDEEDELPVVAYAAEDARMSGLEAEVTWHALHSAERVVHLTVFGDLVRGRSRDGLGDLPLIPPARLGARIDATSGPWVGRVVAIHAFRQDRVAPEELPTGSWTRVDASFARRFTWAGIAAEASIGFRNLLDEEIRDHASTTKDLAPRPGRSLEIALGLSY